jgi:hypothetical protein
MTNNSSQHLQNNAVRMTFGSSDVTASLLMTFNNPTATNRAVKESYFQLSDANCI